MIFCKIISREQTRYDIMKSIENEQSFRADYEQFVAALSEWEKTTCLFSSLTWPDDQAS